MNLQEVIRNPGLAKVAFVVTGGGAPGVCLSAGYCKALFEVGIKPAIWSGTSAGAVLGHILSLDLDIGRVERVIRALPPDAVISKRNMGYVTWFLFRDHLYNNDKAFALLQQNGPQSWGDVKIPLLTWSTRLMTVCGDQHLATPSDFRSPAEAALASMSIPYLFPAFKDMAGDLHCDGGVTNNVPLVESFFDQYDHVFLLVSQGRNKEAPDTEVPDKIEYLLLLLRSMMAAQVNRGVLQMAAHANSTTLYYPQEDDTGMLTFNPDLIDDAYDYAKTVLTPS